MSDIRSWPSEQYAFNYLGLNVSDCLKSEVDLMNECNNSCVPEAIFKHPVNQKVISVEVKRIVGNRLPIEGKGRRVIRRRNGIVWPWTSTVETALGKATELFCSFYMIEEHHVVFIIPDTLSKRDHRKVHLHIYSAVNDFIHNERNELKSSKIRVYIIAGPKQLFDRF